MLTPEEFEAILKKQKEEGRNCEVPELSDELLEEVSGGASIGDLVGSLAFALLGYPCPSCGQNQYAFVFNTRLEECSCSLCRASYKYMVKSAGGDSYTITLLPR